MEIRMIAIILIEPLNDEHHDKIIAAFNWFFMDGGGRPDGWGNGDGTGYGFGYGNGDGYGDGGGRGAGWCNHGGKCPEDWQAD